MFAKITKTKKLMPRAKVIREMVFSAPRSLTFSNRFNPPLPEKALLIPSDFPLCNNDNKINKADTIMSAISSIGFSFQVALIL